MPEAPTRPLRRHPHAALPSGGLQLGHCRCGERRSGRPPKERARTSTLPTHGHRGRRATRDGGSVTACSAKGRPRSLHPPSRRPPSARHRSGAPHTGRRRGQGRPRTGRPRPASARLPNRGWDAAQRGGSSTTRMGPPPPSWELRHSEPSQRWSYLVVPTVLYATNILYAPPNIALGRDRA